MKKMSAVLVSVTLVVLAGCGTDSANEASDPTTTTAEATETTTTTSPGQGALSPTAEHVKSSIGEEVTFCGGVDTALERSDGQQTVFMGALLVYVAPDVEFDASVDAFCVTGTVEPPDNRGSEFISVTNQSQIQQN